MKALILTLALGALAACGGSSSSRATFTCPNGPDLVVVYLEESAVITFPSRRVEELARVGEDQPNTYAKPGVVWNITGFRSARLTDGQSSYACDQMAG